MCNTALERYYLISCGGDDSPERCQLVAGKLV